MSNKTKQWVGKILLILALIPIKLALTQVSWWFVIGLLLVVGSYLLLTSRSSTVEDMVGSENKNNKI